MSQRRGGTISLQIDGVLHDAKGSFSYNKGNPKRDAIIGGDGIHGYSEKQQPPFIEGAITDRGDLDLNALTSLDGVTVTLALANGKVFMLSDAWFAGEGTATTEEGEIAVRFEGKRGEEVS